MRHHNMSICREHIRVAFVEIGVAIFWKISGNIKIEHLVEGNPAARQVEAAIVDQTRPL